jgi:hypothetical protein
LCRPGHWLDLADEWQNLADKLASDDDEAGQGG